MQTHDRCALITGANGGIGQALVRVFRAQGYHVIGSDCTPPTGESGAEHFVEADLARTAIEPAYAETVFAQVRQCLPAGGLHALVNNAAIQVLGATDQLSRDDWQVTLQTNLLAPFFWTQALLPELAQASGSVVNISSIHASQTKQGFVAYATSKAALSAMTRSMAVDLGSRGVRVNAIEPAAVRTQMLVDGFATDPTGLDKLAMHHPLGRIAEPAEIADVAAYLCSGAASFVHGSVLSASGGIHACLSDPA